MGKVGKIGTEVSVSFSGKENRDIRVQRKGQTNEGSLTTGRAAER